MVDKKANDALKKLQRAEDGKKAMAEYEAQKLAVDANTVRLRALRLEREAAAAAAPPSRKPVKKKAVAKTPAAKTLAGKTLAAKTLAVKTPATKTPAVKKTAKPAAKKTKAASGNLGQWMKDQKGSGRAG